MKIKRHWALIAVIVLTVTAAPLATLFAREHSAFVLSTLEYLSEAAIVFFLFRRMRPQFTPFAIAIGSLFTADTLYSLRVLRVLEIPLNSPLNIFVECCYGLFMVSMLIAIVQSFGGAQEFRHKWFAHLLLFAGALMLNTKFVIIPYCVQDHPDLLRINTIIYGVASSFLLAAVLPYALRTTERMSHWFLQLVIMFLIADFGVRFQAVVVNITYFSWAEPGWCTAFVGMAWLCYADRERLSFLNLRGKFAPLLSIRALLTIAICGANILFMLAGVYFGIHSIKTGGDLSGILFLLYAFWFVANEFSIVLAQDFLRILPDMFQSTKHLSADGTLNLRLEKVRTKTSFFEIKQVLDSYNGLVEQENRLSDLSRQIVRDKAMIEIASQVSHDIRSPLSALNMVLNTAKELGEQKRVLMSAALARINDISNDLLQRYKTIHSSTLKEPRLIALEVEQIVSEKRLQFGYRDSIHVSFSSAPALRQLFVELDSKEFKRVISNLINNCYESFFETAGDHIEVRIEELDSGYIAVSVKDNGPGIAAEILARLQSGGAITTKDAGCGLGLTHARRTIESLGGRLQITSAAGRGTTVTITLNKAQAPEWFCNNLVFKSDSRVVVLDDDISVHGVWRERLGSAKEIQLMGFTEGAELKSWYRENKIFSGQTVFLADFELIRQPQSGLDVIEELGVADRTILVTSRYEDTQVRERCKRLGMKILPKILIESIPLILHTNPTLEL